MLPNSHADQNQYLPVALPARVAKKLRLLAKSQRRHGITSLHLALMTGEGLGLPLGIIIGSC